MPIVDQIEQINSLLTLLDRVRNLEGQGIISAIMAKVMREKIIEHLETIFPPPPPS